MNNKKKKKKIEAYFQACNIKSGLFYHSMFLWFLILRKLWKCWLKFLTFHRNFK